MLVVKFIKARGDPLPIVVGWGGSEISEFVPDEEMEGQLLRELISFASLEEQ